MLISFADFKPKIRRRAGDDGATQRFSDTLIQDAYIEALLALSEYSGEVKEKTWTSSADDTSRFTLPDDFNRLLRVRYDDGTYAVWLNLVEYEGGDYYYDADESGAQKGFLIIGDELVIPCGVDDTETITLVYEAAWIAGTDEDEQMNLPLWAIVAVPYYCVYYMLQNKGIGFAVTGEWKTRRDSGNPTDNPALEGADWFLNKFEAICERHIRHGEET